MKARANGKALIPQYMSGANWKWENSLMEHQKNARKIVSVTGACVVVYVQGEGVYHVLQPLDQVGVWHALL